MMRAVIVIGCIEFGTGGECATLRVSGATLPSRTELGSPGVPPTGLLATQFWPLLLSRAALINSSERPPPSCVATHSQLGNPRVGSGNRVSTAQSPSSA